jgi:threonine dehydrogenase-like Zn-dependent dehydrogenase
MWAKQLIGPSTFGSSTVEKPTARSLTSGQVLLRVLVGGICGSDLPFFRGSQPLVALPNKQGRYAAELPGFPMHEVVGEVLESRHPELHEGARVVGWARGMNAIAEYAITDGDSVVGFDNSLDPIVAIGLQPLACVLDAVERLHGVSGSSVAVIGQGPIGVLFSHVVKSMGASTVTAVDRVARHDIAAEFGVDVSVHSSSDRWARSLSDDGAVRPSIVIEAVGHQVGTLCDAVEAVAFGGQIFYFGIPDDAIYPFPMWSFLRKNLSLASGVTRDPRGALKKASTYLRTRPGLAASYVTNVFPVDDVEEAFQLAAKPAPGRLKVVLDMTK